jgi:hypothetical protein
MPDAATIKELRERNARHNAFVDTKRSRNGWASYLPSEVPVNARITNEERSTLEVYDFLSTPPDRYFLYVNPEKGVATTWTGATIGRIALGPVYEVPAFGRPSTRQSIHVWAINGKEYFGTYYKSSGDYARVKIKK